MKKISLFLFITILSSGMFAQKIYDRDPVIESAINSIYSSNISKTISDLVSLNTRHNLSSRTNSKSGIGASYKYLEQRLNVINENAKNPSNIELVNYKSGGVGTRLGREITLTNVVATFWGTDKSDDRVIILLAHYDSRSFDNNDSTIFAPGANDNGSGVSALLEIASALSSNSLPITVKLMFLSGEEHGLLGAAYMSSVAKKENWNIIAVINNDMIGNSRSSGTELSNNSIVRVFSENIPAFETDNMKKERIYNSSENDSKSRQLARYIKEVGERYVDNIEVKLIYRNDRFGRGGDHTPFCKEGFTAVRLCEFYENYDRTHQIVGSKDGKAMGDIPSGVDYEYVRKNSAVNLSVLMNLAKAPDTPKNVKMSVTGLSSGTEISWEPSLKGKRAAYYYVLIRETEQSVWQKKIKVNDTKIYIPYSKDNFFFAVQACDEFGHESLPIFVTGNN